ncbi:hypothetical protein [Streptomyces sp. NPDC051997]|uniref:hypothetical protein n=1 Tax=Streptomyces sp. NPDC051997 TaxID=3155611 RepID=UPI003439FC24
MADTKPGADEIRIRNILRKNGIGPDAPAPVVPPKPTARPRDWLDDILDTPPTPKPEPAAAEPAARPAPKPAPPARPKAKKRKAPKPGRARTAWDSRPPSPRQSLLDAYDRIPYRLKWLAYHASGAYLGWMVGLVDWTTYVTAWIAHTGLVGPQAFLWYAAAACTFLLHHRTRRSWWPVAWLTAVPASSVAAGVLLYGTPHL